MTSIRLPARQATLALLTLFLTAVACAEDRPQWGERFSRNMVSPETDLAVEFDAGTRNRATGGIDPKPGGGVRWIARLGGRSPDTTAARRRCTVPAADEIEATLGHRR